MDRSTTTIPILTVLTPTVMATLIWPKFKDTSAVAILQIPQSVLRSINGSIQYVGSEVGNIYIKVTEADREFTISDLYFDSSDHSIRSSDGNLPYLTVGRQILISGSASNNRVFTISKVIASKYAIEVEEEPVDEDALGNDLSVTVISYEPILVQLAAGERTYSVDGLASDLKISIAAFLDANGNGELDEFADPNGVYKGWERRVRSVHLAASTSTSILEKTIFLLAA